LVHEYVLSRVYELDALLVLNLINTTRGHHHHCGHGKTLASTYQGEKALFGRDWLVVREGTLGGQNMLRLLMGRGGHEGESKADLLLRLGREERRDTTAREFKGGVDSFGVGALRDKGLGIGAKGLRGVFGI
jgi:hypothetical protein